MSWVANGGQCLQCGTANDVDRARQDAATGTVYAKCRGCRVHTDQCNLSHGGRCRCRKPMTCHRVIRGEGGEA